MNAHHRDVPLRERCFRRWPAILASLGVPEPVLSGKNVPCPMCGGRDRFRFTDMDGRGSWICSRCGSGDGFQLLERLHGWAFRDAAVEIEKVVGEAREVVRREPDAAERLEQMRALWKSSQRLTDGDPVSAYLRHRAIPPRPLAVLRTAFKAYCAGDAVRWRPAMVALVTDASGKGVNLHRTFLTEDGRKAPIDAVRRVMPGEMPEGLAVRLAKPGPVMGIAEGIETALSASLLFGVPCWAALNAGRLAVWQPPPGTREVIVYADNDASFTGQEAAYRLAKTLATSGLAVRVEVPPKVGTDWNDVLMERESA